MVFSPPRGTPLVVPAISNIADSVLHSNGVIITIVATILLFAIILACLIHYPQQPACGCCRNFSRAKLYLSAIVWAIELTSFISPTILAVPCDNEITGSAFLSLVAASVSWAVSYAEHSHNVDSPELFDTYLLMGAFLDGLKTFYFSRYKSCSTGSTLACAAGVTRLLLFALYKAPSLQTPDGRSTHAHAITNIKTCRWKYSYFAFLDPMFAPRPDVPMVLGQARSLNSELAAEVLHHRLLHSWKTSNQSLRNALAQACLRTWNCSVTAAVAFRLASSVLSLALPFVLYGLLAALNRGESGFWDKLVLLTIFTLVLWGKAALSSAATHAVNGLACRIRGGLTSLVLVKLQNLTQIEATNSRTETLFSSDIENVAKGISQVMRFAFVLIDGCLTAYCLSYLVGLASGVMVVMTLVATAATLSLGQRIVSSLVVWRQELNRRIWKTSSLLDRLPAIKMSGLGPPIAEFIEKLQFQELESYKLFRMLQCTPELVVACSRLLAPAVVLGTAVLCRTFTGALSPALVFSTWSLVSTQCNSMTTISQAYLETIVMLQSFERIQAFLSLDERRDNRVLLDAPIVSSAAKAPVSAWQRAAQGAAESGATCCEFRDVTITPHGSLSPLYRNVSFRIQKGTITALVGQRGPAKSVLLESILGEAQFSDGTVYVAADTMAFNSHVVWLENASIRDNVIGPLPFESQRFKRVMKACLLQDDLKKLPGSDGYIIGIGGANLTGGQRHRLALARALYAEPSVFLLDDLFSFLDRRTAVSILFRLLGDGGLLRESGCTVIFATSLVESFEVADQFLVVDVAQNLVSLESNRGQAHIANFLRAQHVSASEALEEKQQEALRRTFDARNPPGLSFDRNLVPHTYREPNALWLLFTSIGKWKLLLWCSLILLICVLQVLSKINLRAWVGDEPAAKGLFLGYLFPVLLAGLLYLFLFWATEIRNASNATMYLHQRLLQVAMRSTLGFISEAGSSKIASRFSQSVSHFTSSLPTCLLTFIYYGLALTLHCAVLLQGPKYMTPVLLVMAVCIMRAYVKISGQLRHDKIKEMVRLHRFFQEAAAGLVHSRALRWQQHQLSHGFRLINQQQSAFLYSVYAEEWLQAMSLIIACITTTIIAASALFGGGGSTAAVIGLSLHQATLVGDRIHETARSWAAFDDTWALVSDYFLFIKDVPQEHDPPALQLSPDWPTEGKIEFKHVTARYGPGKPDILIDISLIIEPGQKVCLFGRTGSGKSSLLLAILGFLEYQGTIEIDGVDIASIPRDLLRSRIVALSQQYVPLEGSVRSNILSYEECLGDKSEEERADLTDEFDEDLMGLLADVGAWEEIEAKGGMDTLMEHAGFTTVTVQMICFARAVVRYHRSTGKLVLIDEATKGIDEERDEAVQRTIWELFEGCTILQVAHLEESIHDAELSVEICEGRITHTQAGEVVPPGVEPRSRQLLSPESLIGSPGPGIPSPSVPDEALEDDELSLNSYAPPLAADVISTVGVFGQAAATSVASLRDSIMSPRRALSLANYTNPPHLLRPGAHDETTYDDTSTSGGSSEQTDDPGFQAPVNGFTGTQQLVYDHRPQAFNRSFPYAGRPMHTFDVPFTNVPLLAHGQTPSFWQQPTFVQQQTVQPGHQTANEQHTAHGHQIQYSQQAVHFQQPLGKQQAAYLQAQDHWRAGFNAAGVDAAGGNYSQSANMANDYEAIEGDGTLCPGSCSTGSADRSGSTYLRSSVELIY